MVLLLLALTLLRLLQLTVKSVRDELSEIILGHLLGLHTLKLGNFRAGDALTFRRQVVFEHSEDSFLNGSAALRTTRFVCLEE